MIEIIKEAGTILKDLPELAIWILVGILFYKVFLVGSALALIKYCVNKLSIYLVLQSNNKFKPREVTTKYDLGGRFITHDGTMDKFLKLLDRMNTGVSVGSKYIHSSDVEFLLASLREKRERDENTNTD